MVVSVSVIESCYISGITEFQSSKYIENPSTITFFLNFSNYIMLG